MADYNIYIHSTTSEGGSQSPTQAWTGNEDSPTKGWEPAQIGGFDLRRTAPFLANEAMSFLKNSKVAPYVAAAVVAVKLSYDIIKTATPFVTSESGDFTFATQLNNFEASVNAVFHPVNTTINAYRRNLEIARENSRRQMQRELLGDSEINSYSNRGY